MATTEPQAPVNDAQEQEPLTLEQATEQLHWYVAALQEMGAELKAEANAKAEAEAGEAEAGEAA